MNQDRSHKSVTRLGRYWLSCAFIFLSWQMMAAEDLPIKRIVLFSSGVGFIQRSGEITGDATVELSFRTEQINDILKSLVLQDQGGGHIAPVVYGSRDPIERALKSFAIDLTDNPSLADLLNRARGAEAEVSAPKEIQGVIVGVETRQQKVKEDQVVDTFILNLLTPQGLRPIPLEQVLQIRLLDAVLDQEFRSALKVLAGGRDTQRKPVSLHFTGSGKRAVSVGYILETPVWKTSYRLELRDKKPAFLQGWAIIENTTDDDWSAVNLTLVSGRPISFIMDLYQSLYATRPTVTPEIYASLRPQLYESEVAASAASFAGVGAEPRESVLGRVAGDLKAKRPAMLTPLASLAAPAPMAQSVSGAVHLEDKGVEPLASASAAGELFQYAIDQPVTVARQKSAMLPIVNSPVEAEKLSIYNQSVQPKFPLNGLRLKNTSDLHLMQGPITVFDAGTYAGDARIDDLQPKEERLISYALDLKVEVEPQQQGGTNELTAIQIRKGVLAISRRMLESKSYSARNKSDEKRTVLIEHPFRADWKLLEPHPPVERSPSVYRFRLQLDPGKSEKLVVNEEHMASQTAGLLETDASALLVYSRGGAVSRKVREALDKVAGMKNAIAEVQRHASQTNQQIADITQEQGRIRENMKVLAQNSDLYARYTKKFDDQETQIESLREQLRKLRADEESQRKQLEDFISGLQIE